MYHISARLGKPCGRRKSRSAYIKRQLRDFTTAGSTGVPAAHRTTCTATARQQLSNNCHIWYQYLLQLQTAAAPKELALPEISCAITWEAAEKLAIAWEIRVNDSVRKAGASVPTDELSGEKNESIDAAYSVKSKGNTT